MNYSEYIFVVYFFLTCTSKHTGQGLSNDEIWTTTVCHKLALCAVIITLRIPSLASSSSPPQWCDDQQGLPENVILTDTSPCLFTGCSLQYMYMADLLCLNFCRPRQLHSAPGLLMVSTPLCVSAWSKKALSIHPDQAFESIIQIYQLKHTKQVLYCVCDDTFAL